MSSSPSIQNLEDLRRAIYTNKIDTVKSLLNPPNNNDPSYTKNLLQMRDTSTMGARESVLMMCCLKADRFDILQLVCAEITRQADGDDFLRRELQYAIGGDERTNCFGETCLTHVCLRAQEHRVVKFIVDNILRVGGKRLLFPLLRKQISVYHGSSTACLANALSNYNNSREFIELLVCHLHDFNVWSVEYNKRELHDSQRRRLNKFGMTDSWSPSFDFLKSSLSTVSIFLLDKFQAEVNKIKQNSTNDAKEKLQQFIESKCDYYGGRTILMEVCKMTYDENVAQRPLFEALIDDIIHIVGGDVFCKQLLEIKNENEDGMTCMMYLCRYCVSEEIFNFMFAKIVQCESRKCLYDVLQSSTTKGSSLLKLLMEKSIWFSDSNESVGLMNCGPASMCHLLAHFELFWGQYSVLSKSEQKMLVGTLKIDQNFKADLKVLRDLKRKAYAAEKKG